MRLGVPLVLSVIALPGCNGTNPAGPSQPASSAVTGLAINGAEAVLTGVSASYTATATLSDGTSRAVTPAWISSNPAVGSVHGDGHLDGRSHGSTTLTATYQSRSVSKTIQVVNNYSGTWMGSYVIRACSDSGDLTNHDGGWCLAGPGRVGTVVAGITMKLVQGGTNLTEITGTLGSFEEAITGVVTADGRLTLVGTFREWDWDHEIVVTMWQIHAWDSNLAGPDLMIGRWSEHMSSLYFRVGDADIDNEFLTITRTPRTASASTRRLDDPLWSRCRLVHVTNARRV
jgi:hypothetical protein